MTETLETIADKIRACVLCDLSKTRTNAVPGEGSIDARLLILGEAPGRSEDKAGKPFIGIAGRFLTKTLEEAGIKREKTFITNTVKCRPPDNRKPLNYEMTACRPYLVSQLIAISPKLVLALGATACDALGLEYKKLSDLRGKVIEHNFQGLLLRVFITFHPSFARRSIKGRETFFSDLKEVAKLLG